MRSVNGYFCRNCADEELAKRGIDPAHPARSLAGSEVYVSPAEAARNRGELLGGPSDATRRKPELGVNRPENSGDQGRSLNLYA